MIQSRYPDFGPTLAAEKLRELHKVGVSVETLRKWMMDAEIWVPRRERIGRVYQPRPASLRAITITETGVHDGAK